MAKDCFLSGSNRRAIAQTRLAGTIMPQAPSAFPQRGRLSCRCKSSHQQGELGPWGMGQSWTAKPRLLGKPGNHVKQSRLTVILQNATSFSHTAYPNKSSKERTCLEYKLYAGSTFLFMIYPDNCMHFW